MQHTVMPDLSCEIEEEYPISVMKGSKKYTFGTATISKTQINFNNKALEMLDAPKLRIAYTTQYLVFYPSNAWDDHAFIISGRKGHGARVTNPVSIRDLKIPYGTYKLYKYGQGYCIKRYEPLERKESESV